MEFGLDWGKRRYPCSNGGCWSGGGHMTYQPLDDGDSICSAVLQFLYGICSVGVNRPNRHTHVGELFGALISIFIRDILWHKKRHGNGSTARGRGCNPPK